MMRWTLISDADGHPGWWQMALDQALLDVAEAGDVGFVRLYRWRPFALSFGRHEPAASRYDRAEIERRGLDVVRRPTGGRAVWHARELTYAVIGPVSELGGLKESYRQIHRTVARALGRLEVPATLAAAGQSCHPGAGPCFATSAGGEVLVAGRKLVGSAQLRQGDALLQHGSLLLEDDQRLATDLTLGTQPSGDGVITLREAAGRSVHFEEMADALTAEFVAWGGTWNAALDSSSCDTLVARHAARFQDPNWTWRR